MYGESFFDLNSMVMSIVWLEKSYMAILADIQMLYIISHSDHTMSITIEFTLRKKNPDGI